MSKVSLEEAGRSLRELVERAAKGESVIITSDAGPVARLVAIEANLGHPSFGSAKGLIEMSPDFDEPIDDMKDYEE